MSNIFCVSAGKDSTAMILQAIERGYEVDRIEFCDTLFEFPEIYEGLILIEERTGLKINRNTPGMDLWREWFYGIVTRGENKGKVRGMPLQYYPCYWTREAKVKPLHKIQSNPDDTFFVGIAYDEQDRLTTDKNIRYPLNEWKWTEGKCIEYLNEINMFNPLYVNFDRSGCFFCPKMNDRGWWVLWKLYPDLWERAMYWDKESYRVSGHHIKEVSLEVYLEDFEKGNEPKRQAPKYSCWNGCESVKKAYKQKQCGLGEFCSMD